MTRPSVWMIGDILDSQFAPAADFLRQQTALHSFSEVPESLASSGDEPDAFIVAAARPGRFAAEQIEQLHRRAPLARVVALLGSWCEGEVRSGHPWPGGVQIYAHQWQARLPAAIHCGQPRTAVEIDRLLGRVEIKRTGRQLIGILSA